MTNDTERSALRGLFLDAAAVEFAAELSDTKPVAVSPRFQRQMNAMLTNPQRWAKRRVRPLWKKCVQTAAAILLVCSLSLGTLMAVSLDVRAAVIHWVTEWYETHILYRYSGEQISGELPKYEITALPEGYAETERIEMPSALYVTYENVEGRRLYFDYTYIQQGSALDILTEDVKTQDITVNGLEGQIFLSLDPKNDNTLTWIDPSANLQFTVQTLADESALLHIAESVSLVESTK
ncbi:DUF4367 domain-containing protein [Oscillibacter sp.]|uniref:DUF4367 domain-containing protein n=1 Tax=Oscillibacter sp. TaxID=1945593 RepID=UPI0028977243|nr:DUF4367 domain-containing protein [Oscillibacter sp.]